jgi:hypothetical protein
MFETARTQDQNGPTWSVASADNVPTWDNGWYPFNFLGNLLQYCQLIIKSQTHYKVHFQTKQDHTSYFLFGLVRLAPPETWPALAPFLGFTEPSVFGFFTGEVGGASDSAGFLALPDPSAFVFFAGGGA